MRRDDLGRRSAPAESLADPWEHSSASFAEVRDTPAEVDAVFRTLRRIAATYFTLFLLLVAVFPVLSMALDWWSEARLVGDLSPGFLTAGVGLYVVFAIIGIAAATLSSAVESRMLGHAGIGPGHGHVATLRDGLPGEGTRSERATHQDDDGGRLFLDAEVPPPADFFEPGDEPAGFEGEDEGVQR